MRVCVHLYLCMPHGSRLHKVQSIHDPCAEHQGAQMTHRAGHLVRQKDEVILQQHM